METWGNFDETRGGVGKSGVLANISGNISETHKDKGKFTMEGLQELTDALSDSTKPDHLYTGGRGSSQGLPKIFRAPV